MSRSHKQLFQKLAAIQHEAAKAAAESVGTPSTQDSDTSHPSGSKEDNTQTATPGSRASENAADVKKEVGPPSAENAPASNIGAEPTFVNIGTRQSLTGEDKETTKTTQTPEDPQGTNHPANASTDKYASVDFRTLRKHAAELSNHIMANIVMDNVPATKQAAATPPVATATPAPTGTPLPENAPAFLAGYKTAEEVQQAFASITENLAPLVKNAYTAADLVAAELQKIAADEEASRKSEPTEQATSTPAAGDAASAGAASLPSAGPAAPSAPPSGGGDGDSDDAAVQELLAVLQEMGLTPQDLLQMLAADAGGGAPGAPGGAPPEMAAAGGGMSPADPTMKMAAVQELHGKMVGYFSRHGANLTKFAANNEERRQIKTAVSELVSRSRSRRA